MNTLHWLDYVLFVAFMTISLGIGIFHAFSGGKQQTVQEFLLANRRLKIIPTMLSMAMSYQSAILILGKPAEIYTYGVRIVVWHALAVLVAVIVVERFIVPWIFPQKFVSIYEYFDRRFGSPNLQKYAAVLGILASLIYGGIAIYAPSIALQAVTGIPIYVLIWVTTLACTIYTTIGGIKAVIWTDVFQAVVMISGMLVVLIVGINHIGGVNMAWHLLDQQGRINIVELNPDPRIRHSTWSLLIGFSAIFIHVFGIYQPSVQRYGNTRTLTDAKRTILAMAVPFIGLELLGSAIAMVVTAYYTFERCDPIASNTVSNPNQLLIGMVSELFCKAHGFKGVFLSTLFSGSLSSVSSMMSSTAAIVWQDILQSHFTETTSRRAIMVNKAIVVVSGLMVGVFGCMAANLPGPVTQLSTGLVSAIGGPVFGMTFLGALSRRSNRLGTLVGGLFSIAMNIWIVLGRKSLAGRHDVAALPPLPVDGCMVNNVTLVTNMTTLITNMTTLFTNITDSTLFADVTNTTQDYATNDFSYLHGVENLYGISYLYPLPMSFAIVFIVGLPCSILAEWLGMNKFEAPEATFLRRRVNTLEREIIEAEESKLTEDKTKDETCDM